MSTLIVVCGCKAKESPSLLTSTARDIIVLPTMGVAFTRQIEEEEKQAVADSLAVVQPATAAVLGSATRVSMPVLSTPRVLGLSLFGSTIVVQLYS